MEKLSQAELVQIQVLLVQELRKQKNFLNCVGSNCVESDRVNFKINKLSTITSKITSMLKEFE